MVTYGGSSNNFFDLNTATAASPMPAASYPSGEYPEGTIADKGYNIYVTSSGTSPAVSKIPAGTATISTLVNLPPNSYPGGLDQYSGSQSTAQALAVVDGSYTRRTALINPASASTEPLEIVADESYACIGVAVRQDRCPVGGLLSRRRIDLARIHPIVTSTWSAIAQRLSNTPVRIRA